MLRWDKEGTTPGYKLEHFPISCRYVVHNDCYDMSHNEEWVMNNVVQSPLFDFASTIGSEAVGEVQTVSCKYT